MASTYLRKDYSGSGNRQKQTISVWVKRCSGLGNNQQIFSVRHTGNSSYYGYLRFKTDNSLHYYINHTNVNLRTNRVFEDTNGWYHIVITVDTTQSTAADRIKIYINGVQVTSFQTATYPSQNGEVIFGDNYRHEIGKDEGGNYFDGLMSHFYFITNTAYQASTFGSTDSTTGEWQINTSPTVTYATNSFLILKDSNSGTDQSGQGNNFTAYGTLTKTEDNPSNVFATFNPLAIYKDNHNPSNWLKNGNTKIDTDGRSEFDWLTDFSTLGATSGKYYMELQVNQIGSASGVDFGSIGIASDFAMSDSPNGTYGRESAGWGSGVYSYAYRFDSRSAANIALLKRENGVLTATNSYQTQVSNLQVVMMAWDLDNGKIWFGKENSWFNSGNPSNGSNPALTFTPNGRTFLPYVNHWIHNSGNNPIYSINFGNGFFGTTSVASAGTNASGNGIFEYNTPTGFTALSTKGLNL